MVAAWRALILFVILAAPFAARLDLSPYVKPFWQAADPLLQRFRLDGALAARLVAGALPQGLNRAERESLPALTDESRLPAGQGDRWSDRARAWLGGWSRRLPRWLLVNELPALGRPAAQPVSARPVPVEPEAGGSGPSPAGGERLVLPEPERGESAVPPPPAAGEPVAGGSSRDPLVLIYHSHISEMYHEPGQPLREASRYHRFNSTDTGVARAGAALARALEARGIPVLHDTGIYDYPSHSNAYALSGRAVAAILEQHPTIQAVIDLHRDTPAGMVTTVGGRSVARITLVVGTSAGPEPGPNPWEANAAFARELGQALNELAPGVLDRILYVPNRRYNQDLHPNAILVEVGSYHNTLAEAEAAAELLAASLARVLQARWAQGLTAAPAAGVPAAPGGVTPAGR